MTYVGEDSRISKLLRLVATFSGSWPGIYLRRYTRKRINACYTPRDNIVPQLFAAATFSCSWKTNGHLVTVLCIHNKHMHKHSCLFFKLLKNISRMSGDDREQCISYIRAWRTPQQLQCSSLPRWTRLLSPDHKWRPDTTETNGMYVSWMSVNTNTGSTVDNSHLCVFALCIAQGYCVPILAMTTI